MASIIPLVVASFPFVARLVEASLREIDPGVLEAAQAMGCTPMQITFKVILPESLPSPDQRLHHGFHHHFELWRHVCGHRRRRSGQPGYQ